MLRVYRACNIPQYCGELRFSCLALLPSSLTYLFLGRLRGLSYGAGHVCSWGWRPCNANPPPQLRKVPCLPVQKENNKELSVAAASGVQCTHQNMSKTAAIFSSSGASTAQLDRFALIVPDELLHFLANVSQSAIGKERNEGKSLPPWRCHFHTLGLAACQQTGQWKEAERRTLGLWEPSPRLRSALVFFLKAHGRTWMKAEL
ncbi:hypothetical protein NQZ68_020690 [Dissostichus eleginoides]|nr:hypothetical protein NQZ68_020690 [Dissostichus eleginoides]